VLTEDEEDIDHIVRLIQFVDMSQIIKAAKKSDSLSKNALLWMRYFPQIEQFSSYRNDELYTKLWETALQGHSVLHLAYAFYPKNALINHTEWKSVSNAANTLQRHIDETLATDTRMKGKISWTLSSVAAKLTYK
jgi:hypothetical protein